MNFFHQAASKAYLLPTLEDATPAYLHVPSLSPPFYSPFFSSPFFFLLSPTISLLTSVSPNFLLHHFCFSLPSHSSFSLRPLLSRGGWWCPSLILALGRQVDAVLFEFQASQGSKWRPCLKNNNKKKSPTQLSSPPSSSSQSFVCSVRVRSKAPLLSLADFGVHRVEPHRFEAENNTI